MNKGKNLFWGILLIVVGCIWGTNILGITDIDILFDGWWTLFIILPCLHGLVTEYDKMGNFIGLVIGILLLLSCQDIVNLSTIWKLIFPFIVVMIGVKLLFKDVFQKDFRRVKETLSKKGVHLKEHAAVFSGMNIDYSNETFDGADLNAIFGGLHCDLRRAVFTDNCVIKVSSVFGGIDLFVPEDVDVKVSVTCLFGGVSDKRVRKNAGNRTTLYIEGMALFGGVDIK